MIGVALIAMLAAVSLGAAAPARADDLPRLPPPDPDCSKKYVIESARGWNATFESDDFGDNHISSRYVSAVTSELITTEPDVGSADIAQYNVNVPNSDASGYTGAVNQGAANLAAEIHKNAACGPNRPTLILIGYSQGANVVKQTLNNIASSPDADIIGAAINIGEPTRSNDNRALATSGHMNTVNPDWSPGSPASPDAGGLLDQIPVPNPFADDGRFFDLCRNDDIVCNSAVSGIGNPDAQPLNAVTFAVFDNPGHHSYNEEPRGGVGDQMAQRATARAVALRNKTNSPPPPPPDTTQPDSGTPQVTTPEATVPQVTVPPVTVPPVTVPPVTTPPVTTPLVTTPPVTTPLVTTPPVTTPPGTTPAVTTPPVTIPPVTTPS
ncbi:MAG: cutinase family protein, partial [Mycobacterium sp.]|nr:cutinase family protein [Mycobacterium sp.]